MKIETIMGTIQPQDLGKTYIHEHVRIDLSGQKGTPDTNYDDWEGVAQELKELKAKGIDALVEVTNRGMGRDVTLMQRVAEASGIKIIASTGFYKEPFLPDYFYQYSDQQLAKLLIEDLEVGMDGTNIKAHVIGEIGTSKDVITPMEKRLFQIAIRVHLETGRPISTHTTLGTMALEQIQLFQGAGINPERVVIGHLDLNCDRDYHLRIADHGVFMAFDTIGKINYQSDEKRIEHLQLLIERGHLGQIMLSEDLTRKSHLKKHGGIGYSYLVDHFIPQLLQAGISEGAINQMLIENPRKFLGV